MNLTGKPAAGYAFNPVVLNGNQPPSSPTLADWQWTTPGTTVSLLGQIGAYKVGDYVKAVAKNSSTGVIEPTSYFKGYITQLNDVGTSFEGVSITVAEGVDGAGLGSTEKWTLSIAGSTGLGYDITVDATYDTSLTAITASSPVNYAYFGQTLALSADGNTALVGAPSGNAVYVLTYSAGVWVETHTFGGFSSSPSSAALSADGKTILIGFQGFGPNGNVQVYTYDAGVWVGTTIFQPNSAASYFGQAVAISANGNTALIGAPYASNAPFGNDGEVYVYTRSGTSWSQQQELPKSASGNSWLFGWSVALSADGNKALVGTNGGNNVFFYTRSGTTWTEVLKNYEPGSGGSVALSADGNTALVGVDSYEKVKVFTYASGSWGESSSLVASDTQPYDYFGQAVALSADGNTALIGAPYENSGSNTDNGAAYLFTRSGNVWTEQEKFLALQPENSISFGQAVAISANGNTALIGAPYDNFNSGGSSYVQAGSVYAYLNAVDLLSNDIGAYSSDMYVRATSIVDSSDYFEGTLVVPSVGDPYLFPSITSGNFSTGSVKLSVVGVPGADGVDGDGFSSTNVVSNVFVGGYSFNGSVDNIGAYQVGQFVRLTVTSEDAVNPWIPVGDWIEGEIREINGIGVSIHINGAKPGIVGQYISGNQGISRDTQFSMSVAAPSYTQYAGVYGNGQNLTFSDYLNGWSSSAGPNRPYTVGTRVRIVDQGSYGGGVPATATGVIAFISSSGQYGLVLDAYNAAFDTLSSGSWKDVEMTLTGEPGTGTGGSSAPYGLSFLLAGM
jgi:hypothetical protein